MAVLTKDYDISLGCPECGKVSCTKHLFDYEYLCGHTKNMSYRSINQSIKRKPEGLICRGCDISLKQKPKEFLSGDFEIPKFFTKDSELDFCPKCGKKRCESHYFNFQYTCGCVKSQPFSYIYLAIIGKKNNRMCQSCHASNWQRGELSEPLEYYSKETGFENCPKCGLKNCKEHYFDFQYDCGHVKNLQAYTISRMLTNNSYHSDSTLCQSCSMQNQWNEQLRENPNHPLSIVYDLVDNRGNEFRVQGNSERQYAEHLLENRIKFKAHPDRILYEDVNGIERSYFPDFYLITSDTYIDIKSNWTYRKHEFWVKWDHVLKSNKDKNFDIIVID